MGHSIGDGLIVAALAVAFVGWLYFKQDDRRRRLEFLHAERLAAMEKGIPLPELTIDPPRRGPATPALHVPLILGLILVGLGAGTMIAFRWIEATQRFWPIPLPFALMGAGLLLYYALAAAAAKRESAGRGD